MGMCDNYGVDKRSPGGTAIPRGHGHRRMIPVTSTTVPHPTTRFERGITLALEHFEEITRIAPYVWSVPSSSATSTGVYACNLKTGECSCPDRVPEDERCKHEYAARYVKAKTAKCSGCSKR